MTTTCEYALLSRTMGLAFTPKIWYTEVMAATDNLSSPQFDKLVAWGEDNKVDVSRTHDGSAHTVTIKGPKRTVSESHMDLDYATGSAVRTYNRKRR